MTRPGESGREGAGEDEGLDGSIPGGVSRTPLRVNNWPSSNRPRLPRYHDSFINGSHPGESGREGAGEDEGLDALPQPGNIHDLQEVALHCAQEGRI